MLQTATVKESTLRLLRKLQAEPLLSRSYLVGGTALSLQIGHRESEDLIMTRTCPLSHQFFLYFKYVCQVHLP